MRNFRCVEAGKLCQNRILQSWSQTFIVLGQRCVPLKINKSSHMVSQLMDSPLTMIVLKWQCSTKNLRMGWELPLPGSVKVVSHETPCSRLNLSIKRGIFPHKLTHFAVCTDKFHSFVDVQPSSALGWLKVEVQTSTFLIIPQGSQHNIPPWTNSGKTYWISLTMAS